MEDYLHIDPKKFLFELDVTFFRREYERYEDYLGALSQYLRKVFERLPEDKRLEFHNVLMENIKDDPINSLKFILCFTGVQLGEKEILQNPEVDEKLAEKDIERLEHLANGGLKVKLPSNYALT
ncbi:MAG: hypothetical protein J7K73_03270 [Nanoarchaeota archaeon]|nr:hypothetical protein [Nanoarchaeota archaeon]